MNIIILSIGAHIYSTQRIYKEAKRRGHNVAIVNHLDCSILLKNNTSEIIYKNEDISTKADVIIPRIGASSTKHGASIVQEFELHGVKTTATAQGISIAQNKATTLQLLHKKNIAIPNTVFTLNSENINTQIDALGGAPVVIKLQEGTHGTGVILAESKMSATSIIDTITTADTSVLIQEYIKESNGEDIRAFVVGNKVVAAMKRKGLANDFRSNIHKGGTGFKATLSAVEEEMAIKATKCLGLQIAGVDIIRAKRGSLLLEVNSTPGLQGIEHYTNVNIAKAIVKFLENNA